MHTIIPRPGFSTLPQDASQWSVTTHEGVTMVPTVEGSALRLDIARTSGANWHGELCCAPFPVEAGRALTVSFAARARHPFTFSVWLGQSAPPHASLVPPENHFGEAVMTREWQTYAHRWTPALDEPAARLCFVIGQIDNRVEFRQIALAAADRPEPAPRRATRSAAGR